MALLKIARMGHPVLLQQAAAVGDPADPVLRQLAQDMIETMLDAQGAGLAAPQVHRAVRMIVFRATDDRATGGPDDLPRPPTVVVNPELALLEPAQELGWEGCLSIPGLRGAVPRAGKLAWRGFDLAGRPIGGEATGFTARVLQHEVDHLDGILYPMRMQDLSAFGFIEELARAQAARTPHTSQAETE